MPCRNLRRKTVYPKGSSLSELESNESRYSQCQLQVRSRRGIIMGAEQEDTDFRRKSSSAVEGILQQPGITIRATEARIRPETALREDAHP